MSPEAVIGMIVAALSEAPVQRNAFQESLRRRRFSVCRENQRGMAE